LYVLEIYGLPSEEAAYEALPSLQVGLVWTALRHRLALPFPGQTAPVTYEELPISQETELTKQFLDKGWEKLDGYFPHDQTVIKPEHKKLYVEAVGGGRLVLNTPDQDLADKISEAMAWPRPDKVLHDDKLRLAINLYSSSFFEANDNARFLTLMTVLEALNPNRSAPEFIQSIVDKFKTQTKELRDGLERDDPDSGYEDYSTLLQRLGDLKRESIGKGIRSLIREALEFDPEVDDLQAVAKEMAKIYGWRSDLVHNGWTEEGNVRIGIDRLMEIVPRVLMVLLSGAAKP
jgi:hypothetical protein